MKHPLTDGNAWAGDGQPKGSMEADTVGLITDQGDGK